MQENTHRLSQKDTVFHLCVCLFIQLLIWDGGGLAMWSTLVFQLLGSRDPPPSVCLVLGLQADASTEDVKRLQMWCAQGSCFPERNLLRLSVYLQFCKKQDPSLVSPPPHGRPLLGRTQKPTEKDVRRAAQIQTQANSSLDAQALPGTLVTNGPPSPDQWLCVCPLLLLPVDPSLRSLSVLFPIGEGRCVWIDDNLKT